MHVSELQLNPENYSAEAVADSWRFSEPERHEAALRELDEPAFVIADSGQSFSGLFLNRDQTDETPIVVVGAFLTSSKTPDQMYTAYQYAATNPDRRVLLIDMPSHGMSSPMTSEQISEIYKTRTIYNIGSAQAEALADFMPDTPDFILAGDSLGARVAPDIATRLGRMGLKTELMVSFETVGIQKRLSVATAWDYVVGEHLIKPKLYNNPANDRLEANLDEFKADLEAAGVETEAFSPLPVLKSDLRIGSMFLVRSPLSTTTGLRAIESAMDENPQLEAAFVSAALSKVSHWRKVEPAVKAMAERYPERLRWDLWQSDSHSMGLSTQQPRHAAYARDVIQGIQA